MMVVISYESMVELHQLENKTWNQHYLLNPKLQIVTNISLTNKTQAQAFYLLTPKSFSLMKGMIMVSICR